MHLGINGPANASIILKSDVALASQMGKDVKGAGGDWKNSSQSVECQGFVKFSISPSVILITWMQRSRRLLLLNTQIKEYDWMNEQMQGTWMYNHIHCAEVRLAAGIQGIQESGYDEAILWAQWEDQVKAQSQPLPSM